MRVISAAHNNVRFLNNLLQKNKAVVFFVAPWCGHCKALEPTLNKIMGRFSTSRRDGLLARVSEGNIKNLNCDKDIRGFPTIRVFNNGKKVKDYEGSRDESSLNSFLASVFNENLRKKPIKVLKKNLKRIRKKNNKEKKRTSYSSLLRRKAKKAVTKRKAKKAVTKRKAKKAVTKRKAKKAVTKRKSKKILESLIN
jgi:thioredoxin-like negative regulator of GroEL